MADHRSQVPSYEFPETLPEQEAALAANPLLQRMNEARVALAEDRHRPAYHYVNPESTLNDPNGICFWQGRWHLFYQGYPPEDPRQHWGHAVSDDLVHWRDLPYAIYPDPERCCFSGTTLVEDDRVIAMYHGTEVGNMVAVSNDPLLLNWSKVAVRAVIPIGESGRSADPDLPYTVFDLKALREQRIRVREAQLLAGSRWKANDYVFPNTRGAPLREAHVLEALHKVLERAGLPRHSMQNLRSTYATNLVTVGVHPRVAQELLGHGRIDTTMRIYATAVPSAMREAAEDLDTIMRPASDETERSGRAS
ncbi:MAG TPA: tyrosine-type recombinase/integrase [Chloroflexota bacterium]|nr:tyrosine-type recombinase/integrase [Chloroflexota bacterium]